MRKFDRKSRAVIIAALVITVAVLALVFGPDTANYLRARKNQANLQEMYRGAWNSLFPSASAEEVLVDPSAVVPVATPQPHPDFADLYGENPHLIGWITGGGHIDYPVVQFDDEFYLEHDYYGNPDINGTIFLNSANLLSPRDSMLLIHGHNMKSGAMFGDLDFYREYSYVRQNPIVTFRTIHDAQDVHYVPVAAFDASMNPEAEGYVDITRIRFHFDLVPMDITKPARSTELETYISNLRKISFWDAPVETDSTDEYIMLVSCTYTHEDGRMMLVCRKLRDGETPETIAELF